MDKFINNEYSRMVEALENVSETSKNSLQRAERSFQVVKAALLRIKDYVARYSFGSKEEEIVFFKEVKPKFLREMIFFIELYQMEGSRPAAGIEAQEAYFRQQTERFRLFFDHNRQFYNYYLMGQTHLDDLYFVRGADTTPLPPEYVLDMDPQFSTAYSFKLAKIQAFEQLAEYIRHAIVSLHTKPEQVLADKKRATVTWTDSKVNLIELVYAIYSKGAVNNGQAELSQIASAVEHAFNINLGNYSAVYNQNIRLRKKNRTAGLDQFKDYLVRRMDEADEFPR